MTTQKPFDLDDLKIASPCHESWANMQGDERRRFCESCELHVYDLSGMTRNEAEELVRKTEGRLCLRLHRRADGTVITKDCPVGSAARVRRLVKACAAALLALVGFLPGCKARVVESRPAPGPTVVAPPEGGTDEGGITPVDPGGIEEVEMGEVPEMGIIRCDEGDSVTDVSLGRIILTTEEAEPKAGAEER